MIQRNHSLTHKGGIEMAKDKKKSKKAEKKVCKKTCKSSRLKNLPENARVLCPDCAIHVQKLESKLVVCK